MTFDGESFSKVICHVAKLRPKNSVCNLVLQVEWQRQISNPIDITDSDDNLQRAQMAPESENSNRANSREARICSPCRQEKIRHFLGLTPDSRVTGL